MKFFTSTDPLEVQSLHDKLNQAQGFPHPPDGFKGDVAAVREAWWALTPGERHAILQSPPKEWAGWSLEQAPIEPEPTDTDKRFTLKYDEEHAERLQVISSETEAKYGVTLKAQDYVEITAKVAVSTDEKPVDWGEGAVSGTLEVEL